LEISSSNLTFHISLVDIDALKPHEEVIEPLVDSLVDSISIQGMVRDPLIVDQTKYVILDGMHRHSALKSMRCRFAPCCLVDYDNPRIKVGSWFRLFKVREAESLAEEILVEGKLKYTKKTLDTTQHDETLGCIILTDTGVRYWLPTESDPIQLSRTALSLEKSIVSKGYRVDYLADDITLHNLNSGNANLVITVPVFSKQQIRDFGVNGMLLPHKITRHVMPSRPLRLDVSLDLLRRKDISQANANLELRNILSARKVETKPPGSVVDGRRYEEELLVFTG
jgi:hypothetical protein